MIGPVSTAEFFDRYHDRRALLCRRADHDRFAGLLHVGRIDEILSHAHLPPGTLKMARRKPPIRRSDYTFRNGNVDHGAVIRHFQRGATIILNQLQLADPRLARFCRELEQAFSCHVQTNVYLTPNDSQGFDTHYDDHDVFIIQLAGAKRWRLYGKPVENPYRGERFKAGMHDPGEPEQQFVLHAGDCLYIPRGLMHDAACHGDEPSLHVTTGLIVKKWADLMLEAMSEVALKNPKFRRSLPPGFVRAGFDDAALEENFRELARDFAEQADFGKVLAHFRESFLRRRRPELGGALTDACAEISPSATYVRRPSLQALLRQERSEVVIVSPGGNVHFDPQALPGLEVFLAGEPFSMAAFAGLEEERQIEAIRKLSAFGLIERRR